MFPSGGLDGILSSRQPWFKHETVLESKFSDFSSSMGPWKIQWEVSKFSSCFSSRSVLMLVFGLLFFALVSLCCLLSREAVHVVGKVAGGLVRRFWVSFPPSMFLQRFRYFRVSFQRETIFQARLLQPYARASMPVWPLDPTTVPSISAAKLLILIVCRSRCTTLSLNPLSFRSIAFVSLLTVVSSVVMFFPLFALF
ncbi:hypothetical protein V6N13_037604 [Hibiscus sabdariffa]